MSDLLHPIPYEGKENYIFVSYSHMDIDRVMPIVSQWMKDGYRVWYDDGISPGTEWPEVIAQHLNDCELFVSFLSNSYMDSFNCRREIDFAVRKRKSFLAVFLEETELSLGVEMQISTIQSVDYYKTTPEIFLERFNNFKVVQESGCRAEKAAAAEVPAAAEAQAATTQETPEVPAAAEAVAAQIPAAPEAAPIPEQPVVPEGWVVSQPEIMQPQNANQTAAAPKAKKKKPKFLLPIILGAVLLLAAAGAFIGITVMKAKKAPNGGKNKSAIEFADTSLTAKNLKKAVKGKDIRRIKIENCDLSLGSTSVWGEILNDNVYEIIITGCSLKDADASEILSNAPGLRHLDFSDNEIQNISFANNPKLEKADLSRNKLVKVEKTNFDKLKEIHIDDNAFTDLEFLQTAVHLQHITANRNNLSSIDTLKNCALLDRVCVAENNITDVTALKASTETLRDLDIGHNQVASISSLGTLPELRSICVDNNLLTSLDLVGSTKLSYLSARNNLLDSLNGDWDEITYIDVADNKLSGDYYFLYSEKLKKGFFENNKITELHLFGSSYRSGTFSVYNNPMVKISYGEEATSYDIYISYNGEIGPELKTKNAMHLYLLDCPYDKRVEYEKEWGQFSVFFPEQTEVVEEVEKQRKSFY